MGCNTDKLILVVDDERDIRQLLQECLEMEGYRVKTAGCGAEAIASLAGRPDLILMDVNMPDLDGYLVCEKIRDYVSCPIIFLTARNMEQDRVTGLKAGGDDYVPKPFSMEELLARIEAHLRREERSGRMAKPGTEAGQEKAVRGGLRPKAAGGPAGGAPGQLREEVQARQQAPAPVYWEGDLEVDIGGRRILCQGQDLGLTKTEFNIVEMLLLNRGRVLNKEQIYERVRGYDGCADANIITEHIRRIRRKIQVYSRQEPIVTVWGVGYRWNG